MQKVVLLCMTCIMSLAVSAVAQINPAFNFSRTFGSNGLSQATALALDPAGNVYVTGNTTATNLATPGAYQTSLAGSQSAFVAEFNTNGSLKCLTYLGGSGVQAGQGIQVDAKGNIFVAGCTSSTNFPVLNALQPTNGGSYDAFITELAPGGSNLVFSTYLGGKDVDSANGIVLDTNNSPVITGYTQSSNFPTANAFQSAYGGNGDAFVAKLETNGAALLYSTYLGGSSYENGPGFVITSQNTLIPGTGGALAAALDGSVYVTGWTYSTNFPVANAYQPTNEFLFSGAHAAYVAKIGATGNVVYSTYFGGQIDDFGYAIGVDGSNDVYFAGSCASADLPIVRAFQPNFAGNPSAFLAALDSTGTNVLYCTYLGGSGAQQVNGIFVRTDGAVALTGMTTSPNFPVGNAPLTNVPASFLTSTNGGASWNMSGAGPGGTIQELDVDPFNPAILYALNGSLYKSTDRGQHWSLINNAFVGAVNYPRQSLVAFDPVHAGTFYYGGYSAVYKTTDGGNSWTALTNGLPSGPTIMSLAVDPKSALTLFAGTEFNGIYKSIDGGTNWAVMNTGLNGSNVRSLLVDPLNSLNVYAGMNNSLSASLFRSTNGGTNWSAISGIPSFGDPVVRLAVSPSAPANIYSLMGDFFENSLLLETTNGGASWPQPLQVLNGMMNVLEVVPAPQPVLSISAGGGGVISWPGAFTNFVLQSTPSLSPPQWQNVSQIPVMNSGLNTVSISNNATAFYRLVNTSASAPYLFIGCDQSSLKGLMVSANGGAGWQTAGLLGDTINALAVDTTNPKNVYVGAANNDVFVSTFTPAGQLYSSTCLGGSGLDVGNAITFFGNSVITVGVTASRDFPVTPPTQNRAVPQIAILNPATTSPPTGPAYDPFDGATLLVNALNQMVDCPKDVSEYVSLQRDKKIKPFSVCDAPPGELTLFNTSGTIPAGVNCGLVGNQIIVSGEAMEGGPSQSLELKYNIEPGDCTWTVTVTFSVQ